MQIAIIADTHFNLWRKNNSFFSYLMDFFKLFTEEINRKKVEYIVFAGDLFHTKSIISAEMLLNATNVLKLINQNCPQLKSIYIIPGNHDIYLKNDASWNILQIYQEFPKIQVFNSLSYVDIDNTRCWFLPYYRSSQEYIEYLDKIDVSTIKRNLLFSHIGVDSFSMLQTEDITIAEQNEFIKPKKFKKFDHVYLGHFHSYQTKGNITYVSSPIQSRHGDEHGKHGFVIHDLKTNTHEFIQNYKSPQFLTKELTMEVLKELLSQNGAGKFVRLIVKDHIPSTKLSIIIEKLKKKNYSAEIKFMLNNATFYDDSFASIENWDELVFNSVEELFAKFLNFIETDLDKEKLYKFITSLNIGSNI